MMKIKIPIVFKYNRIRIFRFEIWYVYSLLGDGAAGKWAFYLSLYSLYSENGDKNWFVKRGAIGHPLLSYYWTSRICPNSKNIFENL